MAFSEAELFVKRAVTRPMQLTDPGNKASHLLNKLYQKRAKKERIAPPLGASAVTCHQSINSLQHKSLTSREGEGLLRPSWAKMKESLMEPVVCFMGLWRTSGMELQNVDTDAE